MTTFDLLRLVQITKWKDLEQFILDHKWCWLDEQAPVKPQGIRAWRKHLHDMRACNGAKESLEEAWKEYKEI